MRHKSGSKPFLACHSPLSYTTPLVSTIIIMSFVECSSHCHSSSSETFSTFCQFNCLMHFHAQALCLHQAGRWSALGTSARNHPFHYYSYQVTVMPKMLTVLQLLRHDV
ncbi:hypothetical protein BsWGS_09648 [Bradybaena similaris]